MCSITVGEPADACSGIGVYGPIDAILFPIHHGILGFVGFSVLEPFVVHAPSRLAVEERRAHLARYRKRVLALQCGARDAAPAHG